ncbi:MAG: hypothetical protein AAF632_08940 [Bacteroidota bacterium]
MYKIVNSLATAEYNRDSGVVVVNFQGYGESALYHQTMDIAMNIAAVYNTNKWLLAKDFFQDINPSEFFFFIKKWSDTCSKLYSYIAPEKACQIAVLTTLISKRKLLLHREWLEGPSFSNINLKIFTQPEDAYSFLSKEQNVSLATT